MPWKLLMMPIWPFAPDVRLFQSSTHPLHIGQTVFRRVPKLEKRNPVHLLRCCWKKLSSFSFLLFHQLKTPIIVLDILLLHYWKLLFKFSKTLSSLNPVVAGLSLGMTNALKTFNDADLTLCVRLRCLSAVQSVSWMSDARDNRDSFLLNPNFWPLDQACLQS